MDKKERIALYERAIEQWGVTDQVFMVMEETGEMLDKLGKMNRYRSTEEELRTELVDVCILMEQMAVIFGGYDKFEEEMERKLARLKDKLDKHKPLKEEKDLKEET